jgi:FkbM family methyltransferase
VSRINSIRLLLAQETNLKRRLLGLIGLMIDTRLTPVVNAALSIRASKVAGTPVRVRWDGVDWEFRWEEGGRAYSFYSDTPAARPKVIARNEQLFYTDYKPKFDDIILDVGAGGGMQVVHFSDAVGPSGRVIAIEADPAAVRRLEKQVASLKYQNVEILPIAIGRQEGTVELVFSQEGQVANSTTANVGDSHITVRSSTLESVLSKLEINRISFLKMNIEGAEFEALKSLGKALKSVERLCVSCHDFTGVPEQKTYEDVCQYLASHNFIIYPKATNSLTPWEEYYVFAHQ